MDTRKIRKLIELVKETGIGELEVKSGDDSVRINCQTTVTPTFASITTTPMQQAVTTTNTPIETKSEASLAKKHESIEGHPVKSPMVGTVYLSAAPGTPLFVNVGQKVK